ncbi:hypothetical protein R80B4_00335 [Fibrobacteres bacterium R8-0-B4]
MTTLVIGREALQDTLQSLIGASRIKVYSNAGRVVLTPATDTDDPDDGPNSDYIDPADYPDTTAYLNALPGVAERILAYNNLPDDEWEDVPEEYFHV